MQNYSVEQFVDIGSGHKVIKKDLAIMIKEIVGFEWELVFDTMKPDETPRKLMDRVSLK